MHPHRRAQDRGQRRSVRALNAKLLRGRFRGIQPVRETRSQHGLCARDPDLSEQRSSHQHEGGREAEKPMPNRKSQPRNSGVDVYFTVNVGMEAAKVREFARLLEDVRPRIIRVEPLGVEAFVVGGHRVRVIVVKEA